MAVISLFSSRTTTFGRKEAASSGVKFAKHIMALLYKLITFGFPEGGTAFSGVSHKIEPKNPGESFVTAFPREHMCKKKENF